MIAKKPTKRKVSKKIKDARFRSGYRPEGRNPPSRKKKAIERKHKHGVERKEITRSAIRVLAAGMRQTFDINKSGLYALGVMNTKRGQPAFVAQQEANDIVEEILYQYDRLIKSMKANIDK